MNKDKWINIRCTEQERRNITEQAKLHDMSVAKFIFWLIEKDHVIISKETREVEKITCKDCKNLMFSDMYGECSKGHKGIVQPWDSCSYAEPKEIEGGDNK